MVVQQLLFCSSVASAVPYLPMICTCTMPLRFISKGSQKQHTSEEFYENDNTFQFKKQVSTETSIIFRYTAPAGCACGIVFCIYAHTCPGLMLCYGQPSLHVVSHFHNNSFALRLALKQRHKGTRKWPIW